MSPLLRLAHRLFRPRPPAARTALAVELLEDRSVPAVVGQLRVVSYNILNLPDASAMTTVLDAIGDQSFVSGGSAVQRPVDVLLLQEVDSSVGGEAAAVRDILNGLYGANTYALGTLQQSQASGGDRQAIVYRTDTVNLLGEAQVSGATGPRAPMRYRLEADAAPGFSFYVYNSHYDSADVPDRLDEADAIRTNADALGQGAEILYVGDYNIDSSNEDMYDVELLGAGNAQAVDPINRPGTWTANSNFKDVHTQSTRTTATDPGDGGAIGGMDDRFDFVLHTQEVGGSGVASDGAGLEYRSGSYRAFGNDNTHAFNGALTSGAGIYSAAVRTALMNTSDHLPIVVDYDLVVPDTTPPAVVTIDDGDADDLLAVNAPRTYTVTFSEDILNGSFTAADVNNAGTAAISVGTVTETSAGVFSVPVTPTTGGTLVLRIPAGAVVEDAAGNDLAVPVQDNDTLTVDAVAPTIGPANFADDVGGGPVAVDTAVTFTLTFSEDVANGSFTAADLNNAGTAAITVGATAETNAGVFSVAVTPTTTGTLILRIPAGAVVEDVAGNDLATPVQDATTITVNSGVTVLQVTAVTPTNSGFAAEFNRPLDAADLNLYDGAAGALGAADVAVTGPGGAVRGSLVVDPSLTRVTFMATGGPLAAGTYTVALRSAANGFADEDGGLLDGDVSGTAGGNYAGGFAVGASGARVVSVPDFARGAGQPVNVPATAAGLPLRVSDAAGVTSVQADLLFDPALLSVPTGTFPAGGAFGGTLTVTAITGGVRLSVTGLTGATGANAAVASIGASVPDAAPYASKQVLDLQNVSLNGGALSARDDDAVHVAAYLGDTNGSRAITGGDAALAGQVAVVTATGFVAYQSADPRLLADINGSGTVTGGDGSLIAAKATGQAVPQIPDVPAGANPPAGGPDPVVFVGTAFEADGRPADLGTLRPGGRVTVPLSVFVTEPAGVSVAAATVVFRFDPAVFRFDGVTAGAVAGGALGGTPFAITAREVSPGVVVIDGISPRGPDLAFGQTETLFMVKLKVRGRAATGAASLNVAATAGTTETSLTDNLGRRLVLIPPPTDAGNDDVDGTVTVARHPGGRRGEFRRGAR